MNWVFGFWIRNGWVWYVNWCGCAHGSAGVCMCLLRGEEEAARHMLELDHGAVMQDGAVTTFDSLHL